MKLIKSGFMKDWMTPSQWAAICLHRFGPEEVLFRMKHVAEAARLSRLEKQKQLMGI